MPPPKAQSQRLLLKSPLLKLPLNLWLQNQLLKHLPQHHRSPLLKPQHQNHLQRRKCKRGSPVKTLPTTNLKNC